MATATLPVLQPSVMREFLFYLEGIRPNQRWSKPAPDERTAHKQVCGTLSDGERNGLVSVECIDTRDVSPTPCVDDPTAAYAALVRQFPDARPLLEHLLICIASRTANIGQILLYRAALWECAPGKDSDKTAYLMTGRADMAAFVRDELATLMGSTLGRAAMFPAFSDPRHWTDAVPPETDTSDEA